MKKAYDWFIKFLGVVFITVIAVPMALGLLLGVIFVFCVGVLGMDPGPDKDARAVAALENTGLSAHAIAAPYHAMTIDDSLTAFITFKYDNHEDNTNLWEGIMATAVTTPNWHVEAVTCDAYTARLNTIFPEAAFLLPSDVTFDAWYEDTEQLAFFDQDTGLMVQLKPETQPHTGRIKEDGLILPHNGFMYEYESHGGFHGDGTTWRALIVPEDKRAAFEASLVQHADWHEGTVTPEEYASMHVNMFYKLPELLPDPGITFDWWLHVDDYARRYPDDPSPWAHSGAGLPAVMQEAGAIRSMNWHIALYDADTGLFIYYEYDS